MAAKATALSKFEVTYEIKVAPPSLRAGRDIGTTSDADVHRHRWSVRHLPERWRPRPPDRFGVPVSGKVNLDSSQHCPDAERRPVAAVGSTGGCTSYPEVRSLLE